MAARFSVVLAGLILVAAALAPAQQLQRLHVRSFTLATDTAHPKLEVPFNVTLTLQVTDRVAQIQNIFLPTFIGPEELGDVREQRSGPSGTLYRETLRLVAHAGGPLTIGSAYLEAVDARDGKPKRFISNDLHLIVEGNPAMDAMRTVRAFAWSALLVLLIVSAVVALARFRMRRAHLAEPAYVPATAPPKPEQLEPSEFEAALARLRASRDRDAVMRLRVVLWRIAGAPSGQTLVEVLRRAEAADERLRRMLVAVERAAFVEEHRLDDAIESILTQHERTLI